QTAGERARYLLHCTSEDLTMGIAMKKMSCALALVMLSGVVLAADNPEWAYPVTPKPEQHDNVVLKQVPGSTKQYTQAQIAYSLNPPICFPEESPPMPEIVARGGPKPAGRAC